MSTMGKATVLAAAALVTAAALTSCQDSPLTAQSGWSMSLTANPSSVNLDPNTGTTAVDVDLAALVLDDKGAPQSGVTVNFAASILGLSSGKNGVKTDASGTARDTLHVTNDNTTGDITVTATSASLKETGTITVNKVALNKPPVASIVASPQNEQAAENAVVFDGSASTDPDPNDVITMYKWVLTSTNPDSDKSNPFIAEGPGISAIAFPNDTVSAFHNVQDLTVSLYVTEDPAAPTLFQQGMPIVYRGQETQAYSIVAVSCSANQAPTAVLAGPDTQNLVGAPFSLVTLTLDGTLSSDPETPIDTYTFNCGNGSAPTAGTAPSKATCRYLVDNVPRTYTATLVVTDRGTGQFVNGQYQCQKQSQPASIQVVVTPLTVPGG